MENECEELRKWYCLSRDFRAHNSFALCELEARDEEAAWEDVEETISTSNSQDWLITAEEARTIKELLKDF